MESQDFRSIQKKALLEEFKDYEHSSFFIECCFEALSKNKPTHIRYFIQNHFKQNDVCDYTITRQCAAHWNNVAYDKLNNYNFSHYMSSLLNSGRYRMVAKTMEKYINI